MHVHYNPPSHTLHLDFITPDRGNRMVPAGVVMGHGNFFYCFGQKTGNSKRLNKYFKKMLINVSNWDVIVPVKQHFHSYNLSTLLKPLSWSEKLKPKGFIVKSTLDNNVIGWSCFSNLRNFFCRVTQLQYFYFPRFASVYSAVESQWTLCLNAGPNVGHVNTNWSGMPFNLNYQYLFTKQTIFAP